MCRATYNQVEHILMTDPNIGLTEHEAQTRRASGQGNDAKIQTGRTYRQIIQQNVFNLINVILFVIGAVMIGIGRYGDAFVSVGLIALNIVIGMFQEIRAKRQLDAIALLTRPKITVVRDGDIRQADPSELVIGDIIIAEAGDQIVVDGVLVGDAKLELDESQLTGESDLIPKTMGQDVYSGSFVVSGKGRYEATKVGKDSFANKLTAQAKSFRVTKTPLQREVDLVIRILMMLALFIGFLLLISALLSAVPVMRTVQMAAVVAGLVPNGLFFMVIVAYALGALRIVQKGILVQQSNSVESLSNVTVLCVDKTGTLTANKIHYEDVRPLKLDKVQIQRLLGNFAHSATSTNRTSEAIFVGLAGDTIPLVDEIPFSSSRKWSALAFDNDDMRGVYVIGAVEMLQPYLPKDLDLHPHTDDWSNAGLRVLLFAYNPDTTKLHDSMDNAGLPSLEPLAVVSFSDELRPNLKETLKGFINAGVALKVISGDNPQTVSALAKQAGFPPDFKSVSGADLAEMDKAHFEQTVAETTVFGRITPEQKEQIIEALKAQGHYVAMIGDGVNDVLSLKKANLGIAMQSGSAATRGVADMVLLNDSFGALPPAFLEGQRIINGMQDILRLFLTRALYAALLIMATSIVGMGFPFVPKHASLIAFLTVGIPTFALALWAKPGNTRKVSLVRSVLHFCFPAAISVFVFGLLVYIFTFITVIGNQALFEASAEEISEFVSYVGINYDITAEEYALERALLAAQTALTTFSCLAGLILVIFVEPPTRWWVGGDLYSGDWRYTILSVGIFGLYTAIILIVPLRRFFELSPLSTLLYLFIGGMALLWMLTLRFVWRRRVLESFLGIEPLRPEIDLTTDSDPKRTLITQQVKAITAS
ncbi:MAG: HAD-IC family P-type ATPase [Phototrophicales bacterium]|nr:HAD-IC family P-type ATPase [Phototrophicales bacterium]